METTKQLTGKVSKYNEDRGFGFIYCNEDLKDYFFHIKFCKDSFYDAGDKVRFTLGENHKGVCAKDVQKVIKFFV